MKERAIDRYYKLLDKNGRLDENKVAEYNLDKGFDNVFALGTDVANSEAGDKASNVRGRGMVLYDAEAFPCPDANKLGHKVKQIKDDYEIEDRHIKVDGIGVGAGAVNTLKEYGIEKININFIGSEKMIDDGEMTERFKNLRSQSHWLVREAFRLDLPAIPNIEELRKDLTTPKVFYKLGKIIVESKEEIKKRLAHSPNMGDAYIMYLWNFLKPDTSIKFRIK